VSLDSVSSDIGKQGTPHVCLQSREGKALKPFRHYS
jgi:hypothetical protein